MTVYIDGEKTYDEAGGNSAFSCYFLLIIKDKFGEIIDSSQVGTRCIVNQSFKIYETADGYFDDTEDYYVELKDYLV